MDAKSDGPVFALILGACILCHHKPRGELLQEARLDAASEQSDMRPDHLCMGASPASTSCAFCSVALVVCMLFE